MAKNQEKTIARLMSLFRGCERVTGTHGVPDREPGALKWNIKKTARTLRVRLSADLWEKHLSGERPLGVIPIMDDCTCVFGSVDYDEYDVDLVELIGKVRHAGFPLVPVRSKSGGLHLFLFLREPEAAADVQSVLRDAAASLGVAECEVFPKQTRIVADRDDAGSWLVMPYFSGTFDGKLQLQHGLKPKGTDMTIGEFLTAAEGARTTVAEFAALLQDRVTPKSADGKRAKRPRGKSPCDYSDGPPCMQHLCANGSSPAEGRKRILFMAGIYFKRADPEGWKERIDAQNQRFHPPLPASDVDGVVKSLAKKDYQYTCRESPMAEHCNSTLCRTRKHGVGAGTDFPRLELRKLETDPPIWFASVDEAVVELSTDELLSYGKFLSACASRANKMFNFMQHAAWIALVKEAMERMEPPIQAPEDAGERGRFRELLEEFLTNRSRGERREDLLSGRPWENTDEGRHYFTLRPFQRHLAQEGMKELKRNQITQLIKSKGIGGGHHRFNFGNKRGLSAWWIPSDAVSAPHEVDPPGVEGDEV